VIGVSFLLCFVFSLIFGLRDYVYHKPAARRSHVCRVCFIAGAQNRFQMIWSFSRQIGFFVSRGARLRGEECLAVTER